MRDDRVIKSSESLLGALLLGLLCYPLWNLGARQPIYVTSSMIPLLALGTLMALIFSPSLDSDSRRERKALVRNRVLCILKDPVTITGLMFLVFVFIQWYNAGAVRVENGTVHFLGKLHASPIGVSWLPFAFGRREAWIWWCRFFPALIVVLSFRHGFSSRRVIRLVLYGVLLNAVLYSTYGIMRFFAVAGNRYLGFTVRSVGSSPFSNYPNHAAAYLVLSLATAFGLVIYCIWREKKITKRNLSLLVLSCLILVGGVFTLSRSGFLFFAALCGCFVIAFLYTLYVRCRGKARLVALAIFLVSLLAVGGGLFKGRAAILAETKSMEKVGALIDREVDVRFWQWEAAQRMWKDYPAYGSGGWSARYIQRYYLSPKFQKYERYIGKANIHNDPMQFLSEFGWIGCGLMAAVVLILLASIFQWRGWWREPLVLFILLGSSCTVCHSLFDLPFRSSAVLWIWLALLASAGKFVQFRKNKGRGPEELVRTKSKLLVIFRPKLVAVVLSVGILWCMAEPFRRMVVNNYVTEMADSECSPKVIEVMNFSFGDKFELKFAMAEHFYQKALEQDNKGNQEVARENYRKALDWVQAAYELNNEEPKLVALYVELLFWCGFKWEASNVHNYYIRRFKQNKVYINACETFLKRLDLMKGDKRLN